MTSSRWILAGAVLAILATLWCAVTWHRPPAATPPVRGAASPAPIPPVTVLGELERLRRELEPSMAAAVFGITRAGRLSVGRPPTADPEWSSFPCNEAGGFANLVPFIERSIRPATLFRHRDLNPRDIYVPPDSRSPLGALVRSHVRYLDALGRLLGRLVHEDLSRLIERGEDRVLVLSDSQEARFRVWDERRRWEEGIDPSLGEPQPFFSTDFRNYENAKGIQACRGIDGVVHAATRDMLPRARDVYAEMDFVRIELAGEILHYFVATGLLEPDQAQRLLCRARELTLSDNG